MRMYTKKCMREREIAVVELADLGDRTRSLMPAMAEEPKEEESSSGTAEKRSRDVRDAELEFRSTRRRVAIDEATESLSPAGGEARCGPLTSVEETNCASELVSCSSSNALEIDEDRSTIADPTAQTESAQLETLTFSGGRERSRETPSSEPCAAEFGNMESTAAANSSQKSTTTVTEMPSESEIEDFFSVAENDLHKRFSERYNFDIVNGVPLEEGRYEWIRVKPAMR